jgi:hypothetical protein
VHHHLRRKSVVVLGAVRHPVRCSTEQPTHELRRA